MHSEEVYRKASAISAFGFHFIAIFLALGLAGFAPIPISQPAGLEEVMGLYAWQGLLLLLIVQFLLFVWIALRGQSGTRVEVGIHLLLVCITVLTGILLALAADAMDVVGFVGSLVFLGVGLVLAIPISLCAYSRASLFGTPPSPGRMTDQRDNVSNLLKYGMFITCAAPLVIGVLGLASESDANVKNTYLYSMPALIVPLALFVLWGKWTEWGDRVVSGAGMPAMKMSTWIVATPGLVVGTLGVGAVIMLIVAILFVTSAAVEVGAEEIERAKVRGDVREAVRKGIDDALR